MVINSTAQKKWTVVFDSYNSVGFMAGKLPVSFTAQTENGIAYKKWFAGAGLAIDMYYRETLPLFVAVKREITLKTNSLFLYANAGKNIVAKHKKIAGFFSTVETKGGFYVDAGIGYKIKIAKKSGIFFSMGNCVKSIMETEESTDAGFPYAAVTKHKFSRIVFRLGYQF